MKTLLIDINSVLPAYTLGRYSGIGRTTKELVMALSQNAHQLDFEIKLYSQNTKHVTAKVMNTQFKSVHLNYPNRANFNELFNVLPIKEWLYNYDLMHLPTNYGDVYNHSKTLITIHDAMFFAYPEEFLGHGNLQKIMPKMAQACKGIVTCSEASKSDIVYYMDIPEEKVTVVPWGVDRQSFFEIQEKNFLEKLNAYHIVKPFFLMVSCDIGRKNTINVMRAFAKLQTKDFQLVLVWSQPPNDILQEFESLIKTQAIIFLANIDDQILNYLYNGAVCSFFPSKYEGFGLPILESFECGTPVVTCYNSSLKEVGGDAALYVDPDSTEEMCQIMQDFVTGKLKKVDFNLKVKEQAKLFDWQNTAQQYIKFYQKHLG